MPATEAGWRTGLLSTGLGAASCSVTGHDRHRGSAPGPPGAPDPPVPWDTPVTQTKGWSSREASATRKPQVTQRVAARWAGAAGDAPSLPASYDSRNLGVFRREPE